MSVTVATPRSELIALNVVGLLSETMKLLESPVPDSCSVCGLINIVPAITKANDGALCPWSSLKVIRQLPAATGDTLNEVPLAGVIDAMPLQPLAAAVKTPVYPLSETPIGLLEPPTRRLTELVLGVTAPNGPITTATFALPP